jgi:hypothetical protein
MALLDDFREFLQCLNASSVRYLVVGGHAVSFHGYPRFTHDIDLVVVPDLDNAERLIEALHEFGFGAIQMQPSEFTVPVTVALGRAPHQIDLMTYIKGVDLEEAWNARDFGELDGVAVCFISKPHLLLNKQAVGRPEDLADIARLRGA